MPVEIFCCYARKDQQILKELHLQLIPLQREGLINLWADTDIEAGTDWEKDVEKHLNSAHIILLLVSPYFIASEYCYSKEMMRAMERHEAGEAQVVPIILRPVLWENMLFGKLQALPKDAIPVTSSSWHNLDEALYDIAKGIQRIAFKKSLTLATDHTAEVTRSDHASNKSITLPQNQSHQNLQLGSARKGNALEEAVRLIEQTILHNNPATRYAGVTIEPRKLVVVNGVKHEIDLYITIDFGKNYQSVFIFECKNWEKAVGKNEIIVFSEKINAVHAQRGFFVAKSFGTYAREQAARDKRIELLTASTELDALPSFLDDFHYVQDTILHADLSLNCITSEPQKVGKLTFTDESSVRFIDEELLLGELSKRVQSIVKDEVMNHEPTGTYKEGVYHYDITKTLTYQPNELFVDGYECRKLTAHVQWESLIVRPAIVSQFDIQTRGKIISLESDKLPGGRIMVLFIAID